MYDNLNRLLAGFYQKDTNPSAKEYFEKIDYDVNGNIISLKRPQNHNRVLPLTILTILAMSMPTITKATDSRPLLIPPPIMGGYPDTSGTEIGYDNNGNMTSHMDKGILNISYNFLNLPKEILFSEWYIIRNQATGADEQRNVRSAYIYRTDEVKLRKKYTTYFSKGGVERTLTTDYLDGFQYTVNHLGVVSAEFIPTSEGYFNFKNSKYIYNYVDHLGNVRLSYFNNGTGIEVLEENNYYPFGLKHEGYNALDGNTFYQYKYNGKELQETGMYDYGARFYMPDIGRWEVNPLAEQMRHHSHYTYAFNNPIRFIDPDGRSGKDWVGTTDANGSTKWHWDDNIKNASQAAAAGYDSYSNGKTNNTYTSISGSEVTLKENGNWYEDFTAVNETTLDAAQAKMFGKYTFGIFINMSYGNISKSYSLAYNLGTEQFKIFETDGVELGGESSGEVGFSLFQMKHMEKKME